VIQISRHIRHLSDLGFVFVNAFSQLSETPEERHVMLILIDPEPDVIEALDPILQQYNSRVVYAGNAAVPVLTLSGQPIPERLSPILASGRWQLASGGPSDFSRHSVNNSGVLGNPLTHPLITDQSEETATEFAERLDQELATASQTLKENNERILVYPSGDFGQRSLDFLPDHLDVLHSAVSHHFTHAICFDSCGFYLPSSDTDPLRIPARIVPPDWDENELLTYLTLEHPLTRSWLELARVLCWNGQYEAAHKAFIEAEKAGADPIELNFNHGMNAYWQGDLPTAKTKLQAAQMLDPEAERIRLALARLDDRRRPQVTAYIAGWKDNEDRDHYRYGGYGNMFISERIRLGVAADRDRWKTDGLGSEYGTRLGVQGLAFLAPQVWLTGSIWQLDMDNLDNHWGGDAMLRVPNPLLSGFLGFGVSREEIETVEALRANIDAETYTLRTYTRLIDVFDLYADLKQITRSDGNDTSMLDGRLLYRLQEWPYIGVGWRFRIADSDRDPPEYWAPEQLQQHQLHITVRGAWKRLSGFVSAEAGYADERDTDWRFVWGARSQGNLTLTERLDLTDQIGWSESPDYERLQGRLGLTGQF